MSRKRKKGREDVLAGVKLRKASSGAKAPTTGEQTASAVSKQSPAEPSSVPTTAAVDATTKVSHSEDDPAPHKNPKQAPNPSASPSPVLGLGLAAYSSDEDD